MDKSKFKKIIVNKGQILQHTGELNSKIYFVKSGLLRSYYIDKNGKEHIFMFAPENSIIADSVFPEIPCELFIEALENSVVIQREKNINNKFQNKKLINRLMVLQMRIIMLMSATALERYEYFLATYAEINQRVPQKMIASYLGITPETLSRVRKEILQRK